MLFGGEARLRGDAAVARERWPGPVLPAAAPLPAAALVIDALFGAGLDRPLEGAAAALVAAMNAGPAPVVAVDVPLGLDADTGRPLGRGGAGGGDGDLLPQEARAPALSGARALRPADARRHRHPGGGARSRRAAALRERPGALAARAAAAGARGPQVPARPRAGGLRADGAHRRGAARRRRGAPGRRGAGDAGEPRRRARGQRRAPDGGDARPHRRAPRRSRRRWPSRG